ncbi:IS701 family transposase [Streptomyces sp. NPDC020490]|uniref:IS701 family transposase n=1 Tax=Streptomyces sp. NPDC020490 TaxID=3365078 RepID=UPI00378C54FF
MSVDTFAQRIFGYLPRADQRRWAQTYLKGLLLTDGRKSMRRVAESVSGSPTVWYSLQQFINSSPWEWGPARDALAQWIEERSSVRALTITPVALPKRGDQSVGVHQRFDVSSGRTVNCQLAVGLFLSCPGANFPVDWRLVLPRRWTDEPGLRRRARIPETESYRPQWRHMVDLLLDGHVGSTCSPDVPVVADMGDATELAELTDLLDSTGRDFIVAINPRLVAPREGRVPEQRLPTRLQRIPYGRTPYDRTAHDALRRRTGRVAGHRPAGPDVRRTWSQHTAAVTGADGRFRQAQVLSTLLRQPARKPQQGSGEREQWAYRLFTELAADGRPGSRIWFTNLTHHRLDELLELTRLYVSSTVTADCMDGRYELLDFAGRSFPAWHHHMTMASAAYAHLRLADSGCPSLSHLVGQRGA